MHLKSIVFSHKNALFLIPPYSVNRYQIIKEFKIFQGTQSVTSRALYVSEQSNNKKYLSNIFHSQCFNGSTKKNIYYIGNYSRN